MGIDDPDNLLTEHHPYEIRRFGVDRDFRLEMPNVSRDIERMQSPMIPHGPRAQDIATSLATQFAHEAALKSLESTDFKDGDSAAGRYTGVFKMVKASLYPIFLDDMTEPDSTPDPPEDDNANS